MTEAVLGWQAVIFITILISGRYFKAVTIFWFIWTLTQIFVFWLSALQFFTVFISAAIAGNLYGRPKKDASGNVLEPNPEHDEEPNINASAEQQSQEDNKFGIFGHIVGWGLVALFWATIVIF
ncbi:hypothetical protein DRW07_07875 [Alteromonas sediminis]|uniref:Uncharacterized protein n=1 Tax=Alteromonas sediminis TaxID=2259342 RepID=A0A3N5Y284_9ALTE|nr:hypothetical protein [Alteromonas sediminis]RPJ67430.1 hypothetical protein DRW07_07875 [Alteromonas sediminis]